MYKNMLKNSMSGEGDLSDDFKKKTDNTVFESDVNLKSVMKLQDFKKTMIVN